VWIALAPALAAAGRRPILVTTAVTAACVWGADLAALLLKIVVGRPRPFRTLAEADPLLRGDVHSSFPSGHAATSFAGALVLAYLFRRALPWLVVLAAGIAFSRVYVGVHYPLDVLAGAALGSVSALVAVTALRARRRTSAAPRQSGAAPPAG
jgi:membrane-associated phospholipid phosphatase